MSPNDSSEDTPSDADRRHGKRRDKERRETGRNDEERKQDVPPGVDDGIPAQRRGLDRRGPDGNMPEKRGQD